MSSGHGDRESTKKTVWNDRVQVTPQGTKLLVDVTIVIDIGLSAIMQLAFTARIHSSLLSDSCTRAVVLCCDSHQIKLCLMCYDDDT